MGITDSRIKNVRFNEEEHRYRYEGKELHGVTSVIGSWCGKAFPDTAVVELATIRGHDVHKESEMWIKERRTPSTDAGRAVIEMLKQRLAVYGGELKAELLVSDFAGTASCIDVVQVKEDGRVALYDIKTTSHFDRRYCSYQLSTYKYLYERVYGGEVDELGVIKVSPNGARVFSIVYCGDSVVENILKENMR